jgi:hypothetical protein
MIKMEGNFHFRSIKNLLLCLIVIWHSLAPVLGNPRLRREKVDSGNTPANPTDRELKVGDIFDRFLMIVLENMDYDAVMSDSYFQNLKTQGALFSNFDALSRPSFPNYVAMVAGSTFGIDSNDPIEIQERTVVDLFEKRGLTWRAYAEGYPGNCYLGESKGKYVRHHVPFLSFSSIQDDPKRCSNVVPADEFLSDWNSKRLPNYSMYVPDNNNNGHDTGLAFASNWLQSFLDPLLADSDRMTGTLIQVVFDEPDKKTNNMHIFSLFLGPMVRKGLTVDTNYNFYNVLRTVEGNFNIGTLGMEDSSATSIKEVWV